MKRFVLGHFDDPYILPSWFNVNEFICLDYEVIDEKKVYYALIRFAELKLKKVYISTEDFCSLVGISLEDLGKYELH